MTSSSQIKNIEFLIKNINENVFFQIITIKHTDDCVIKLVLLIKWLCFSQWFSDMSTGKALPSIGYIFIKSACMTKLISNNNVKWRFIFLHKEKRTHAQKNKLFTSYIFPKSWQALLCICTDTLLFPSDLLYLLPKYICNESNKLKITIFHFINQTMTHY